MFFLKSMPWKVKVLFWAKYIFLFLLSVNNVCAQTNAEYLKSLEGEVSNLKLDSETKSSQNSSTQKSIKLFSNGAEKKLGGAISDLNPGLTIEQFEIVLKNNYIGSFLFYKRLTDSKKGEVYQFYQNNPDPQKVREKILQENKK